MASTRDSAAPPPSLQLDATAKQPLLAPLVLANHLANRIPAPIPVDFEEGATPTLILQPGGEKVEGGLNIIRELATIYASEGVTGKDKDESAQVDLFIAQADKLPSATFQAASAVADDLDQHLALRTFLVGHSLTAADIAVWGAFRATPPILGLLKKGLHVHLSRWASHLDSLPEFAEAQAAVMNAKSDKFRNKKAAAGFELFLQGAKEGEVVTRFPPEPSGYLHVGHAKAAILNQYFAKQYKGRLIVRFDDTNPSKEKVEFEDSIIEDLALLGIQADKASHTSDYFDELYRLVIELVKKGMAYADDTEQMEMRAQRMDGIPSKRRDMSVEDTLARFAEMSSGTEEGKRWCLRAKMSVDNPNKAMRDPVIYRVNSDVPHHRTGSTWKVYPTYDFACPVVDSLEGVTHALRTNEYRDRNPQYFWFIDALNLRKVEIWDFGRVNFVYTLLSKRKLQWFVDKGFVTGWDDPRFPTVRGIRRRGMTIDCIQQFMLAQGPSQQIINMEWDSIWSLNKRLIDPVVPRHTALDTKDLVKCTIKGAPPTHEKAVPKHKKNLELGNKTTVYDSTVYLEQEDAKSFADNEEITLMDWGNVFVRSKSTSPDGTVTAIEMEANLDGDFKKTEKKVTWLASTPERQMIEVSLLDFDYLITKKKLDEEDKFEDFVTPESEFRSSAMADANIADLAEGAQIQFERKGYYVLDKINGKDGKREFIHIPDGKAASSASKAKPDETPEARKAAAANARAKKTKKNEEEGNGATQGGDKAFPELVETDTKISMYHVNRINEDLETPAKTNMYHVKPIL